jgi:hypothetical protein
MYRVIAEKSSEISILNFNVIPHGNKVRTIDLAYCLQPAKILYEKSYLDFDK